MAYDESAVDAPRLRALIDYFPETGTFSRKAYKGETLANGRKTRSRKGGPVKGYTAASGYVFITVDDQQFLAHRLAHCWMTGEWPTHEIDHKDADRGNNQWENLRPANRQQNARNTKLRSHSRVGLKGVGFFKVGNYERWTAHLGINGRTLNLGYFHSPEEAHAAYCAKAQQLYGEFFRAA